MPRLRHRIAYFRVLRAQGMPMSRSLRLAAFRCSGPDRLCRLGPSILAFAMQGADAVGAKPLMFWGTLLGHRREGRFLAHDNDIDLCILPEDVSRIDAWTEAVRPAGISREFISPYQFRLFFKAFRLLWIDVWIMHPNGSDYVACLRDYKNRKGVFVYRLPKTWFRVFDRVWFEGCHMWEPRSVERILTALYGDWQVPRRDYYDDQSPSARLESRPPAIDLLMPDSAYPADWAD